MIQDAVQPLRSGARSLAFALGVLCFSSVAGLANTQSKESQAYYDKAVEFADLGQFRSAVVELKNALQRDPENADARLLLGRVYLMIGDGASAEKELLSAERYGASRGQTMVFMGRALLLQQRFQDLLDDFPADDGQDAEAAYEMMLIRAEAHAGLGEVGEARTVYRRALAANDEDPRVYLGLAGLDMAEQKFDSAEEQVTAALALDPQMVEASVLRAEALRLKGDPEAAVPFYREILGGEAPPAAAAVRAHLGLAAALLALGRDEEAETEVLAARAQAPLYPLTSYLHALVKVRAREFEAAKDILDAAAPALEDFTPAQFLFGIVYYNQGDLQTARTWLNRHLTAHDENLQARKLLAATFLRLDLASDAIALLERGLKQAPDDPQLLLLLGNAHLRVRQPAEASEFLQRAARNAPQDPRVLGQLAISQLARGRNEEALAALNTTLDLDADGAVLGYILAFAHLRTGEFDEALKVAQKLRGSFPESALAINLEGGAYAALGRLEEAQASFAAVLAIDPQFHEARANLAALKAQGGDLKAAEAEYRAILRSDQNHVSALMGLALVARRDGDPERARELLTRAAETNPQDPRPVQALAQDYVTAGETERALAVLSEAIRGHADSGPLLAELGRLQIQANRPREAVRTYERLVAATDGASDARLLLAQAHLAMQEPAEARRVLEVSFEANPEHLTTLEVLLQLLIRTEGVDAALAYAERLWRRYPKAIWGERMVGDLHLQAERVEEAIATYKSGWTRQPSAKLAIGLYRARLRKLQTQPSSGEMPLQSLREWLEIRPEDDGVRMVLADALLSLGQLDEARKTYETLKESQANNPVVWNNLAWLYDQAGDGRAVAHGERALQLAPNSPAVKDTLGWILLEEGDQERAFGLLEQAHAAIPDNPEIAYHFAVALHRGGQDAAAKEILQTILSDEQVSAVRAEAEALLAKLTP